MEILIQNTENCSDSDVFAHLTILIFSMILQLYVQGFYYLFVDTAFLLCGAELLKSLTSVCTKKLDQV